MCQRSLLTDPAPAVWQEDRGEPERAVTGTSCCGDRDGAEAAPRLLYTSHGLSAFPRPCCTCLTPKPKSPEGTERT